MNRLVLVRSAAIRALCGAALIGLFLFLPAGTMDYPNAWLLLALLFVPMAVIGAVLAVRAPQLLEKRINMRERMRSQSRIIMLSGILLILSLVLSGLDFRFRWSPLPQWMIWTAAVLFLLGYTLYAEVLRENAWLSRTLEIQEGQQLVDTGLYGIVRHPMYMATVFIFLSMPLVLGSLAAFAVMLSYPLLLASRIAEEEQMLLRGLSGYAEYMKRVRWRMFPLIW